MSKRGKHSTPDPVPTGFWVVTLITGGVKTIISEAPYHDRYAAQRYLTAAVRAYAANDWTLVVCGIDKCEMVSGGVRDVVKVEPEMVQGEML